MESFKLSFLLILFTWECMGKVVFLAELCRHGARAPLILYPWDQDGRWTDGPGELTALGMRQHYLIGSELRRRYPDLFSSNYTRSHFYVRSTNVDRTLMSAESQLLGLFPQGLVLNQSLASKAVPPITVQQPEIYFDDLKEEALPHLFQPIPIHTVPAEQDLMLMPQYKACPRLVKENENDVSVYQRNESISEFPEVVSAVKTAIGKDDDYGLSNIRDILDSLRSNEFQGFPLPPIFTPDVLNSARNLSNKLFAHVYKSENITQLWATGFFSELLHRFERLITGQEVSKFRLYSAHDSTVAGVLAGLDKYDDLLPAFASTLLFEVSSDSDQHFSIKVIYNDKVLSIPPCSDSETCPLETFMSYLKQRSASNIKEACQMNAEDVTSATECVYEDIVSESPKPTHSMWKEWVAWVSVLLILLLLCAASAAVVASYRVSKGSVRKLQSVEGRDLELPGSARS